MAVKHPVNQFLNNYPLLSANDGSVNHKTRRQI